MTDHLTPADTTRLRQAIAVAARSRADGTHPFGSIVVDAAGEVVASFGNNSLPPEGDPTQHAELRAVAAAARALGADGMRGSTLYTSAEPCVMCTGAAYWMGGVPYDAEDLAYGKKLQTTVPADAIVSSKRSMGMSADDDSPYFLGVPPEPQPDRRPQMTGSTDVGDVSWVVPTVQISGATAVLGTPGHSWQMVAQGKTPAAHKGMIYCAEAMASVAYDLITDADLLAAAKKEHAETMAATPYDCPIPEGVVAPPARPGYTVR